MSLLFVSQQCQFVDGKCVRCGVEREPPYPKRNCRPGLGDSVSNGLNSIGITKQRVQAAAAWVGVKDCGCEQRQQQLNELGYAIGIGEKPAFANGNKPAE